jgi:hypothetical protein
MGAVLQERGSDEARGYSDCMTRVKKPVHPLRLPTVTQLSDEQLQ